MASSSIRTGQDKTWKPAVLQLESDWWLDLVPRILSETSDLRKQVVNNNGKINLTAGWDCSTSWAKKQTSQKFNSELPRTRQAWWAVISSHRSLVIWKVCTCSRLHTGWMWGLDHTENKSHGRLNGTLHVFPNPYTDQSASSRSLTRLKIFKYNLLLIMSWPLSSADNP